MSEIDIVQYPTLPGTKQGDQATLSSLNALMSNTNREIARNLTLAQKRQLLLGDFKMDVEQPYQQRQGIPVMDSQLLPEDYQRKAQKMNNETWKDIAPGGVDKALPEGYRLYYNDKINRAAVQPQTTKQADEEQIVAYLIRRDGIKDIPLGLKGVLKTIYNALDFPGVQSANNLNEDLKTAVNSAFRGTRKSANGPFIIKMSLRNMISPTDQASAYDKVVMRKARRIIRLLKSSLASNKMKADVTLSKNYQMQRGYYNDNKLEFDPSAKVQYIKQTAKKYGTLDPTQVKNMAVNNLGDGLVKVFEMMKPRISGSKSLSKALTETNTQKAAILQNLIPDIRKDPYDFMTDAIATGRINRRKQ